MAELESSLISERVKAGMQAAHTRDKKIGRPKTPQRVLTQIEQLAQTTELSVRQIHNKIGAKASRGLVGEIVKQARGR